MSRFCNINGQKRTCHRRSAGDFPTCVCIVLTLFFGDISSSQPALAQNKSKAAAAVRTDEKGRKFINKIPLDVFFDNPLAVVSENRNAVGLPADTPTKPSAGSPAETKSSSAAPSPSSPSGEIVWKEMIPLEDLQSEMKLIRNSLTKSMANQGSYKSNFKEIAIDGAEVAALASILQAHSESLTWKDKSHFVREFGTQLNQSANGLSKESFENTRAAFQKLTSVLDGSVPDDAGDVPETRPFNEAASRKGLMKRIERAKNFLQQDVNSEAKFKSLAEQARREAAVISALGSVITTSGYEYTSDDDYQKHARSLIDGGKEAASALQDEAYDRFKQAVDRVNKSCTDCHASYGNG